MGRAGVWEWGLAPPINHPQSLEWTEVPEIGGHEHKVVNSGDGGNLAIDEGRDNSPSGKSGSLFRVPLGRRGIVGQNGNFRQHHLEKESLNPPPCGCMGKPTCAIEQFMPNRGACSDLAPVLVERLENLLLG